MPISLPPTSRRQFIKASLALGGGMVMPHSHGAEEQGAIEVDQSRVALLADTHIHRDPDFVYPGTKWPGSPVGVGEHESVNIAKCLTEAVRGVLELSPRPAHLIVNGDCAFGKGLEEEYRLFLKLIEPIRNAGITIHVTIGNHDNRDNLWKLLPFLKVEQMGVQADVVELPLANLILMDSGKGLMGEEQLNWLAKELSARADKPALVFGHYNPFPSRGVRPIKGLHDGPALLGLLAKHKHVRAYMYGHTHEWQYERRGHVHLIGQPAVSYYFGKGHAHGWIDMKLDQASSVLELRCIDRQHAQHGATKKMI